MRNTTRFLLAALLPVFAIAADWPTSRGNPQRTGNVDGQPGPRSPKILWTFAEQEHYVSSLSAGPGGVYVPALGGLNAGLLHCMSADPAATSRIVWTKKQPVLTLPTTCPPAVLGDRLVFGDGMHQNQSPNLYCLTSAGQLISQLNVPGPLIHIEGTPTLVGDRAWFGAGAAGVVCVDLSKLTIDQKEVTAAQAAEIRAARWKELQAKYEADKKKDPDFAVPPSEDQLPKPAPRLLWQSEKGKLHVDSPIAVVGESVLAASAYLDQEKEGDRALHCLNAADGKPRWRAALNHNPWAGPSVSGDIVVLGCSSIRFEPREIPEAKGEVVALSMADGSIKWRQEIPGGVVSPVAIAGELAIAASTDRKVRAFDLKTGQLRWTYDGKAPYFAGVAVAGDLVFAADLNGVVQALSLADGKLVWRLDINKETKTLANIYGSPIVHGGCVYVATCSIALEGAAGKNVVVCIGAR